MEVGLAILPKREPNSRVVMSTKYAQRVIFMTNHYEFIIKDKSAILEQYSFETDPELPGDSNKMQSNVLKAIRDKLKEKIGKFRSSGKMIWSTMKAPNNLVFQTTVKVGQEKKDMKAVDFSVVVRHVKTLNVDQMNEQELSYLKQIRNIQLKETLKDLDMVQLNMGTYYQTAQLKKPAQPNQQLKIERGFVVTLIHSATGQSILLDTCSRIFQTKNFLETMNGSNKEKLQKDFTGTTVVTNYGKIKNYRIESFQFDLSPKSSFITDDGQITYLDYYWTRYNYKIHNLAQPLLKVITHKTKEYVDGKKKVTDHYGYIVPEMVRMTGFDSKQQKNFTLIRETLDQIRIAPKSRMEFNDNLVSRINRIQKDFEVGNPKAVEGYQITPPNIILGGGSIRPQSGEMRLKTRLLQPAEFKDWLFVYTKATKNDDNDADDVVESLKKASNVFGIKVNNPAGYLTLPKGEGRFGRVSKNLLNQWKAMIKADIDKNGAPEILFFLVDGDETQQFVYAEMKRFLTNEMHVVSQFAKKRTILKAKNPLIPCSKILIQMGYKVNCPALRVEKRYASLKGELVASVGISLSRGQEGFCISLVGTTNDDHTSIYSDWRSRIQSKEAIGKDKVSQLFIGYLKRYFEKNQKLPTTYFIYRDGLSDIQIKSQVTHELEAIHLAFEKASKGTKTPNYKPKVVFICTNKRIDTRMYFANQNSLEESKKKNNVSSKMQVSNPPSGSVVFEELSQSNIDFHMVPQCVTQGTVSVTKFTIVVNEKSITMEDIALLTYDQCFNYGNWSGAVRLPACLQLSNKLAKQISQFIKQPSVPHQGINDRQHFL